jgi:hypothetical protein
MKRGQRLAMATVVPTFSGDEMVISAQLAEGGWGERPSTPFYSIYPFLSIYPTPSPAKLESEYCLIYHTCLLSVSKYSIKGLSQCWNFGN